MVVSGWYRNPLHLKALDGVSTELVTGHPPTPHTERCALPPPSVRELRERRVMLCGGGVTKEAPGPRDRAAEGLRGVKNCYG